MGTSALADSALVHDVLSGRRDRFDVLIERYYHAAYAVAYSRTGNPADAQDVTQEAFLRAFSTLNTLRDTGRFGAWLTGIARNVARNVTRSAARELPRESVSGEAAVEPNVESKDLHEFLLRQLATLDDDDREVLLMHYFTGLTTREIGDALAISRETAKKRLQRAREALSERVISELGDALQRERPDKDEQKQVMAIVAAAPLAWTPLTSGAATAIGGATLASKIVLTGVAAAAIAVLVVAIASITREIPASGPTYVRNIAPAGSANPSTDTAATSSYARTSLPAQLATAAGSEKAATPKPAPDGDAMVVCEVLDPDGQPAAGARVVLVEYTYERVARPAEKVRREAQTDARGWAIFDRLPPKTYAFIANKDDRIGFSTEMTEWAQTDYMKLRVLLEPAAQIQGVVRDELGSPVPDSRVFPCAFIKNNDRYDFVGRDSAVVTGANGEYSIALPVEKGQWQLAVEADGFAPQYTEPTVAPATANVILNRGRTATVRVYRADTGAPVANLRVVLTNEEKRDDIRETQTGADGYALFLRYRLQQSNFLGVTIETVRIHPRPSASLVCRRASLHL